jgi:hypothetical protein
VAHHIFGLEKVAHAKDEVEHHCNIAWVTNLRNRILELYSSKFTNEMRKPYRPIISYGVLWIMACGVLLF